MKSDGETDRLNDNNLIIVRRSPGYFLFLWYVVLLDRRCITMAKRRPSGDGMVRRKEDGRWEGRIVVGHKANGDPIFRYVYGRTQKELMAKLHQSIETYQDVELTEDSRITLGEWLDRWLDEYKAGTVSYTHLGAPHHLKPCLPVIRIADQRFCRWDHQQRDVCLIGEFVICTVLGRLIVPADALVQNGIGNGLDHIPVIVRTAQALRRQHGGVHHDKVGEMAEVVVPHLQLFLLGIVEGELQFFISGDMGVAQQSTGISMLIGCALSLIHI